MREEYERGGERRRYRGERWDAPSGRAQRHHDRREEILGRRRPDDEVRFGRAERGRWDARDAEYDDEDERGTGERGGGDRGWEEEPVGPRRWSRDVARDPDAHWDMDEAYWENRRAADRDRARPPMERDERHEGRFAGIGPKGYRRSDDRIREDVCDRLTAAADIDAREITVTVRDGEVILEGTVEDRRTKRAAEDCAEDVPGVREVQNHLRIGAPTGAAQTTTTTAAGQAATRATAAGRAPGFAPDH